LFAKPASKAELNPKSVPLTQASDRMRTSKLPLDAVEICGHNMCTMCIRSKFHSADSGGTKTTMDSYRGEREKERERERERKIELDIERKQRESDKVKRRGKRITAFC